MSLFTYNPPVILTAALPPANVAPVAFVASVNVTRALAARLVNAPLAGVTLPIGVLLIWLTIKSPSIYISLFVRRSSLTTISPKSPAKSAAAFVSPTTISVAACAIASVVTLSFNKLNTPVSSVSMVLPLTIKLPSNNVVALAILNVPVAAPMLIAVASPNALTVVAPVLARVNVPPLTLKSLSPPICRFPVTSKSLLIVVVPVLAPIPMSVPAPNALIVVALVLNTLKLVLEVLTAVAKIGLVLSTKFPVPVSSLITPAS